MGLDPPDTQLQDSCDDGSNQYAGSDTTNAPSAIFGFHLLFQLFACLNSAGWIRKEAALVIFNQGVPMGSGIKDVVQTSLNWDTSSLNDISYLQWWNDLFQFDVA